MHAGQRRLSRLGPNSLRKYDCSASRPTGIFIAKANDRSPSSSSTVNDAIWRSPRCTAAASEFLGSSVTRISSLPSDRRKKSCNLCNSVLFNSAPSPCEPSR